jgi:dihydropteroate synthase
LAGSWEERLPAERREWATAAAAALAVAGGAELLRLHDPSALQALRIAGAIHSSIKRVAPYGAPSHHAEVADE